MRFLALLVFLSACANVTTMKIEKMANGSVKINSGKDVRFKDFHLRTVTGEQLDIGEYSSAANTDAINAQATREIGMVNAVSTAINNAIQTGMKAAAKGMGVP